MKYFVFTEKTIRNKFYNFSMTFLIQILYETRFEPVHIDINI